MASPAQNSNQGKEPAVNFTSGVFDRPRQPRLEPRKPTAPVQPEPEVEQQPQPQKEAFPDVFKQQSQMASETMQRMKTAAKSDDVGQAQADRINQAMADREKDPAEDEEKITAEEMSLAEQLIFKGYAEMDVELGAFPGKKMTICSTNADELGLIDDVVFEMVKNAKSNKDGTVDLPENHVTAMRNAVFVAISYRGIDGKELSPDVKYALNTIKKAVYKLNDLYGEGDLKAAEALKVSLRQAVLKRAMLVKRLPTTMIDFISRKKLWFDSKMSKIMEMKTIVPKS